jgi:hypothetical protein|tara:strand:- start:861 stop:1103 length:243 start_codon:yes stop_codon:yes gene_type:complete
MENNNTIKLTEAQEAFVKMANEEGFTTEITRKDIISLQGKHGITKPAWLMKNTAFRVGRASYSLPTLGQTVETTTESDSE